MQSFWGHPNSHGHRINHALTIRGENQTSQAVTMMRQRRAAHHSPTSTICYDDVETCYAPPVEEPKPKKIRRAKGSSCCSKLMKRLGAFVLLVFAALFTWSHCQRAIELYNLPGVQEFLKDAPTVLEDDYIVFLTASTGEPGETYVKMGRSKRSATYALMHAQSKIAKLPIKFPWIKVDVVDAIERIEDFDYFNSIDAPGDWFGIAFDWDNGPWAFLPDEVQSRGLIDKENVLRWEKITSYARAKKLKGWPIPDQSDDATSMDFIDVFHTSSMFYDLDTSNTPIPVYHGHRMYDEITPEVLRSATIRAGEYMAMSVDDDKTFVYNYLPRSDYEPSGYNLTRHAAAIFVLSRLFSKWEDAELLDGLKAAIQHLLSHAEMCAIPYAPEGHTAKCIVEQDDRAHISKLGINALTVLALAEYTKATKDTRYLNDAKSLAKWIGGTKREDGSFVHRVDLPNFELNEDHFVGEYHGQVAFSLSRLYNVIKALDLPVDESWIDVAVAATNIQVAHDEDEHDEDQFVVDHWLLHAIGELPSSRVTPSLVEYAMQTVHIAVDHQNEEMEDEDELDELGVYFNDLSATATAAKTEGLCAIYQLAVEKGRAEEAKAIFDSVILAIRYQLQAQFQPENALYMRDPKRIIGGFHESIIDTEMRLDHTYHNLGSLLCTADMISSRSNVSETK